LTESHSILLGAGGQWLKGDGRWRKRLRDEEAGTLSSPASSLDPSPALCLQLKRRQSLYHVRLAHSATRTHASRRRVQGDGGQGGDCAYGQTPSRRRAGWGEQAFGKGVLEIVQARSRWSRGCMRGRVASATRGRTRPVSLPGRDDTVAQLARYIAYQHYQSAFSSLDRRPASATKPPPKQIGRD
jgi:hypothetical protein